MSNSTSKKAMLKGLGLLVALICVFALMSNMETISYAVGQMLSPRQFDVAALEATNAKREEHYKLIAGFWEHKSDSLFDRIEILENGIIWQYTQKKFILPNATADTISRISTSFLHPVSFEEGNIAMSDLRMIREVWIMPDTCFGRRSFLDYAQTKKSDGTLFFNGVAYTRYEGEIREFFPVNSLSLLRPNAVTISMPSCGTDAHVLDWLRQRIAGSFENRVFSAEELRAERENLLNNYFIPLSLTRIESRFLPGQEMSVDLRILVAADGSVDTVFVRGQGFASQASRLPIINEVSRWRFPAGGQRTDTLNFVGTVTIKR